ncbi:hypothetical protein [Terrisporobacter sp.]
MLNNWSFKKHSIMSIIFSLVICLVSYLIINPSNSAIIGLIFTDGKELSVNIGIVQLILITLVALLLSLFSYKIIKR